jgi:hypothetical protein
MTPAVEITAVGTGVAVKVGIGFSASCIILEVGVTLRMGSGVTVGRRGMVGGGTGAAAVQPISQIKMLDTIHR